MENIVFLAFIAALCTVDIIAFGQFMICRPIFCAPLIGFFMSDISTGLWIGMIAEMIWINAIPMGVAVPIDASPIGILSTFWVCKYFMNSQEAAIWGLILAIPFAYLYRGIDISGRNFNIKIMHWVEKGIQNEKYGRINLGIIVGVFFFVARAFLFYVFAMVVGGWIYKGIYLQFPEPILIGFKKAWYLLPIAGLGMVIYNLTNVKPLFLKHHNHHHHHHHHRHPRRNWNSPRFFHNRRRNIKILFLSHWDD
ncbi:PTS sugar transporter subunit IIC [Candidatus Endomicrobiellum agilis]|uniref:PTS sugar transporter subunit IIC n=1 Tax=Candidatus Endomicrobiellum agilis TaxID=3238957 RepID=UPI0035A81BB2